MIYRAIEQTGDTIIEVLVAMAVLMMVLVGAYVTANRSLNSERNAQEHTEALTIAQGQVEDLHADYQYLNANLCFNPSNPTTSTDGYYCYENSAGQFDTSRSETTIGLSPASAYWYEITVSYIYDRTLATVTNSSTGISTPVTSPTYEVTVSWPSLSGGTGNVQLYYRPE
jgi:Tfp pilus assembly protein PilV